MRRRAVRHLNAGNDSCRRALARKKTAACVDGHTRRSCRKSLSLHWLHADFRSSGQGGAPKSCAMRADPSEYKLVSPGNLQGALSLLAAEPAQWLPIAGGTDVMVLYSAGKLLSRNVINIWNIPELRQIEVLPDCIRIGAACTYTSLRNHDIVGREFSLLATTASWTGGVGHHNPGTLGGHIANTFPAARSLPPPLGYKTGLTLISLWGEERWSF